MFGKTSRPVIKILTGSLVSGHRAGQVESKNQSPTRGPKSFDFGGIGLGIVAALEKSGDGRTELQASRTVVNRSLRRSVPIPISSHLRVTEESCKGRRRGDDRIPFRIQKGRASVFHISPVKFTDGDLSPDFLNTCDSCQKKLQGKDIYMYRGEKGFCSEDCRYRQMAVEEEPKEKCGSETTTSPYAASGQIFRNGILAA